LTKKGKEGGGGFAVAPPRTVPTGKGRGVAQLALFSLLLEKEKGKTRVKNTAAVSKRGERVAITLLSLILLIGGREERKKKESAVNRVRRAVQLLPTARGGAGGGRG